MEVNKLKEIQENLLIYDRPSIYLEEIKSFIKKYSFRSIDKFRKNRAK